jgi:hypothetical protein
VRSDVRLIISFSFVSLFVIYLVYKFPDNSILDGVLTGAIIAVFASIVSYFINLQKAKSSLGVLGARLSSFLTLYSANLSWAYESLNYQQNYNKELGKIIETVNKDDNVKKLLNSFGSLDTSSTFKHYYNKILELNVEFGTLRSELHSLSSDIGLCGTKLRILRAFVRDVDTIYTKLMTLNNEGGGGDLLDLCAKSISFLNIFKVHTKQDGTTVLLYRIELSLLIWLYSRSLTLRLARNPLRRGVVHTDTGQKLYIKGGKSIKNAVVLELLKTKAVGYENYITSTELSQGLIDRLDAKEIKFGEHWN